MSATQVPLQPIAKGSVLKFWLAMAALVALAFAAATCTVSPLQGQTSPTGVNVRTVTEGTGDLLTLDDAAMVEYRGTKAADGELFDENIGSPTPMIAQGLIPGFAEAWTQMREGGTYRLFIPGEQAYGATPPPGAPFGPNEDLVFEVTIREVGRGMAPMVIAQRQQMQGGMVPPPTGDEGAPAPETETPTP